MSLPGGWRSGAALGAFAAGLLLPALGHAQTSTPSERSFSLHYRAPAGCPDGLSLVAAIQERTERAALVAPEVAAVRLSVELLDDGRTKLQVDMPEGSFRRDYYASCFDAVASIAVIASMVLEAEPAKRVTLIDRAPEPAAPGAAAFPPDESQESLVPPSKPEPEPAKPKPVAPPPARVATPRAAERSRLVWAVTAGGAVETAVAPTPPLGVTAGLEGWLDRSRWWAPGVQASFFATAVATHTTADGQGKFQLFAGHLMACGLRLPIGDAFRLLPCAVFEAGSYQAKGAGEAVNVQTATMPWWAGGASLRAQLEIVQALALEGSAGFKVLARADTFEFRPESLVYEVPRFSAGLGLSLLFRLP